MRLCGFGSGGTSRTAAGTAEIGVGRAAGACAAPLAGTPSEGRPAAGAGGAGGSSNVASGRASGRAVTVVAFG